MDLHAAPERANDGTQTVLVVDDEPDIADVLAMTVETYLDRVRVCVAYNAKQALHIMQTQPVGLVISDYKMPGMDGLELLNLCRQRYPSVPRIMMTAYPDMEIALRALQENEVSAFIHKPLKKENVVVAIASALHRRVVDSLRSVTMIRAIEGLHKEMEALRASPPRQGDMDPVLEERRAEAVAAMSRWGRQAESAVASSEARGERIHLGPLAPPSPQGRKWSPAIGGWVDVANDKKNVAEHEGAEA